jgi:hypothetical protein
MTSIKPKAVKITGFDDSEPNSTQKTPLYNCTIHILSII